MAGDKVNQHQVHFKSGFEKKLIGEFVHIAEYRELLGILDTATTKQSYFSLLDKLITQLVAKEKPASYSVIAVF